MTQFPTNPEQALNEPYNCLYWKVHGFRENVGGKRIIIIIIRKQAKAIDSRFSIWSLIRTIPAKTIDSRFSIWSLITRLWKLNKFNFRLQIFSFRQTDRPDQTRPDRQSTNQSINQSINKSINQSITQPINQSINQPINQPINNPINPPINQSTNLWIKQWMNESNNQSIKQSIKQTINQTINQSIVNSVFLFFPLT